MVRQNEVRAEVEGPGGSEGIVLPLELVQNGIDDVAYTIPVLVGASQQNLSLQVDTGSSDLWIASISCSSQACSQANAQLYNPSQATQTGQTFSINYLVGNVSGPIVWDQVDLGGYIIPTQALAAADVVQAEPLSESFEGVLGLALPLNSIIAQEIPPVTGNSPDGAAFPSNLFGITPASTGPSSRFLSISLERPGFTDIPSLLGIGRHPSELVTDPSKINYATIVSSIQGDLFWKANVPAITVYVDGQAKPISLGSSASGSPFLTATLDTGVPLILTTSSVANGIYGAIGISPASDGQYYLPCTLPLNMTITLDDRPEIPLHPLDLSADPPQGSSSGNCIGIIQSSDTVLTNPTSPVGDMILGVPFLRNVYTVMAYEPPDSDGNFDNGTTAGPTDASVQTSISPRLGLLNLTNPTVALQEFHNVRVLNQPPGGGTSATAEADGGKKLSVGVDVLIGLVGFVLLCFALFAVRWCIGKRKWERRDGIAAWFSTEKDQSRGIDAEPGAGLGNGAVYQLARRGSRSSLADELPSEDTLRTLRYEEYLKKERIHSEYTINSARTVAADYANDEGHDVESARGHGDKHEVDHNVDENGGFNSGEFGYRSTHLDRMVPPVEEILGDATLVSITELPEVHPSVPSLSLFLPDNSNHQGDSIIPVLPPPPQSHPHPSHRQTSASFPVSPSSGNDEDLDEFGAGGERMSMAGIGTAARGGWIDASMRNRVGSFRGGSGLPVESRPSLGLGTWAEIGAQSGSGQNLHFWHGLEPGGLGGGAVGNGTRIGVIEETSQVGRADASPPLLPPEPVPRSPSGPRPFKTYVQTGVDEVV